MSSWVTKWRASDDLDLIRFMSYIKEFHDLQLTGSLAPEDEDTLVLAVWPDTDWNGDPETTASTSGLYCEIISGGSGRKFPLTWTCTYTYAHAYSVPLQTSGLIPVRAVSWERIRARTPVAHIGLPALDL